ncbi:hypothetical protein QNI19_08595 [Cytophagaceae bacterium DM2B3-1]|uniref:Uncharacterized protein n=1 Tax=Xanthocytophaga flava TaxID=3048013 RepID=A0ABT7CGW2_9BACT|nr:hypothetical protein [Xanthocytophaga flavus]MDJ1492988.1 hypothetical protein [Xanthocytophaga flavus]
MRKSELEDIHRLQLIQIRTSLERAGWEGRKTNLLFEEGGWVPYEAVFDYYGSTSFLIVLYKAEEEAIELLIEDPVGRLNFLLFPGKAFDGVLTTLIAHQNTLTCNHYKDFISIMLSLIPNGVFVFQNEQQLQLVAHS